MENFKLDLSKLTPVAKADRVKGNWYVVADDKEGFKTPGITQYHSSSRGMDCDGKQSWAEWKYWFAIPPNLPGFPQAELPDEFELVQNKYEYYSRYHGKWMHISALTGENEILFRRIPNPKLPILSIPEQTASERREWLQRELEKLNK